MLALLRPVVGLHDDPPHERGDLLDGVGLGLDPPAGLIDRQDADRPEDPVSQADGNHDDRTGARLAVKDPGSLGGLHLLGEEVVAHQPLRGQPQLLSETTDVRNQVVRNVQQRNDHSDGTVVAARADRDAHRPGPWVNL